MLRLMLLVLIASFRLSAQEHHSHHHTDIPKVDCSNQASLLQYEKNASGVVAPFAHGHSKDAFHATLNGQPVVVKRPRNDFADERLTSAVRAFANELDRVHELRGGHPGIPTYYGGCLEPRKHHGEELTIVTERLTTWWQFHSSPRAWCELVYSAISMVSLARFLQGQWHATLRPTASGFLHCSINRAQFAFGPHGEAKLVDYGGLHRFDAFPAYVKDCTHDKTSECELSCMKSWSQHHTHQGILAEFECDAKHGKCHGFDPAANLWAICASMMAELLETNRLTSADAGGEKLVGTQAIDDALHKCLALHKTHRIRSDELHELLVDFLVDNEKRSPCIKRVGLELDPIYMDVKNPLRSQ